MADINVLNRYLTRRTALKTSTLFTGSVLAGAANGLSPSSTKVWRDMTQSELDAAYDQSVWAPDLMRFVGRYGTNSQSLRKRKGPPSKYAYGPTPIETLDVFKTSQKKAPIVIYIHGGAWKLSNAAEHAYLSEMYTDKGAVFVIPDFAYVQDYKGDLSVLVEQLRRAMVWIYQNADAFGGDKEEMYICGHSSGGHLAGTLLTTDWEAMFKLPPTLFKGGLCTSGMFDLLPVSLSARRNYIAFTPDMVTALSPIKNIHHLKAPLVLTYGNLESPEFKRQTQDFAKALTAAGKPAKVFEVTGYNHFEIVETLGNPFGLLGREMLKLMSLS